MPKITLELDDDTAEALAQFAKRSTFEDFSRRSADDAEAYQMIDGINELRHALAEAGFAPR